MYPFRIHRQKELGGGIIIDMGVYVIQLSQWVFKEAPKSIKARGTLNSSGVDSSMEGELRYSDDKVAHISASGIKTLKNTALIRGTKGEITVNVNLFTIASNCFL